MSPRKKKITHETTRVLGIDLSGAKNQKTTIAVLEHYPKQKKIFLLDVYDQKGEFEKLTPDQTLLHHIQSFEKQAQIIGLSVPQSLPPCIVCTKKTCPLPHKCKVPSVKFMREQTKKAEKLDFKEKHLKAKDFTPYTQRPIELWLRYRVFPKIPEKFRFDINETLGGNMAPLSARMHFLKFHLKKSQLVEVSPKLSLALLALKHKIPARIFSAYRDIERGIYSRKQILEQLCKHCGIFVYQKDLNLLASNMNAFHSFVCAYTALLEMDHECEKRPKSFPKDATWMSIPKI